MSDQTGKSNGTDYDLQLDQVNFWDLDRILPR